MLGMAFRASVVEKGIAPAQEIGCYYPVILPAGIK